MDALEASHGTVYREPEGRVAPAGAIVETSRLYSAIYCTWVGRMIRWVGDTVGSAELLRWEEDNSARRLSPFACLWPPPSRRTLCSGRTVFIKYNQSTADRRARRSYSPKSES